MDKYCKSKNIKCDENLFSSKNEQSGKAFCTLNEKNYFNRETNLIMVKIFKNYEEADKAPATCERENTMDQTVKILYDHEVKNLVECPKNAQILVNKWLFTSA